ncbi:MAG: TonB-dependent receptor [Candidatus Marinimicrobia bacterium]|jgi:iron complex outermembrane receptor protein|nr:TonB-dependent receptor [Candidatus Neomarinimicrobiota bacterium]MBT3576556.1 TonB-dependent receptor [Candidatus Neomarinimicrobiota bacterium]MBT3680116.1 TonB-dependent receptor [Candidatus Neomarinimicrobiota bacterium]MBT3951323.1 TonB-dependent receptor [Candidatus Neomarinimicrobiota bacterium]MBT4253068.1 TonB-dependent receptor [Candidatus Neomarinimicrobiota bacterium]
MIKSISALLVLIIYSSVLGQTSFTATIHDEEHKEALVGANAIVKGTSLGGSSDIDGYVEIQNIPDGRHVIVFSYIGYEESSSIFTFPLSQNEPHEVFLHHDEGHTEEVHISATRSSRTIADIPTRIEAISGEELNEKGNMKPGDIRMLLNESTGIQTQQTSATSYNSSIRIQGLDGKYTQILKDGFPLYSGFSGGLSLLQIVPLDLSQVEVIKGASSTLHGGGAIAGLVNLVSKTPSEKRELSVLLNATSALGLDASAFYSQKTEKLGTTVFVSYNLGTAYDPADIGLTAIPEFKRYTINPKLFVFFSDKTTLDVGFNTTLEERIGGDLIYIEGNQDSTHSYFEKNETTRFSTQIGLVHHQSDASKFSLKNSYSYYDRTLAAPGHTFAGIQNSSFSEVNYSHQSNSLEWVAGLNIWTDQFVQNQPDTITGVDYDHLTMGAFVQSTWNASEQVNLETGLRFDSQNDYGNFLLPRLALLWKVNQKLVLRAGGGLGYKTPSVFSEDAERLQFRDVLPIDVDNTNAEKSLGTNFDINYRTPLTDEISLSINSLLFYTRIDDPILLGSNGLGQYEFSQPDGVIDTRGIETNIKLSYDHFKLFIGYTLADVQQHYSETTTTFPLVSRHRLNNVLMYEKHDDVRIGLEAYYFSPQNLSDGSTSEEYWILGLMTEKMWDDFSLFLNFENFLDTRQTKFEAVYTGSLSNPQFKDIYAPVDGFVINGGLKIRF